MKKLVIAGVVVILAFQLNGYTQTVTPVANARQITQHKRIADGRKSGELTNKETAALKAQQRHIRRTKRRAKADGDISPRERARIHRKQNRANRHIRRQKHDAQTKE